jgi:hypothetical protein
MRIVGAATDIADWSNQKGGDGDEQHPYGSQTGGDRS